MKTPDKRAALFCRRMNLLEALDQIEHRIQLECRRLGLTRGAATRLVVRQSDRGVRS